MSGFRTATTKSTDSNADGAVDAPTSWYSASEKKDPSPAPDSTTTSIPPFTSRDAAFGVRATLRSPSAVSLGTPTLTSESSVCSQPEPFVVSLSNHETPSVKLKANGLIGSYIHSPTVSPLPAPSTPVVRRRLGADLRARRSRC